MAVATVRRFEAGALVRKASVAAVQEALEAAGVEFIPVGGQSLRGGEGVRIQPTEEPEVVAAKELAEVELATDSGGDMIGDAERGDQLATSEPSNSKANSYQRLKR